MLKQRYSNSFFVLFLITIIVLPMAQSQMILQNSEVETESQSIRNLNPLANPVAPVSPEIQYSGDPGGAYSPEPELAPTGPQTLIVLLVYFSDLLYTESVSTFDSIIFGDVDDYYQEISFGQCSLSGTVSSWYNLGNTVAYYGADGATSGKTDDVDDDGDNDSYRLVDDAIAVADPFVDFSSYGHIMVLHAGNGQESSGISTDIWSVRWSWPGHFVTDEKTFDSCSIVPETQGGDVDRCVGVIAHEFGHDIGLPDLYHVGHVGEDDFVDEWGLMASGTWNGVPAGASPAHPMAYCKIQLEWITNIQEISYDSYLGEYLYDQETLISANQVIKVITGPSQYYLVEVRSNYGNDAYLPSTGVLISYCDESLGSGQGIVKIKDAHPETTTLDDAAYQSGESFLEGTLHIDIRYVEATGSWAYITVMWKEESWIDNLRVSSSTENQYNPDIASDDNGNLYITHEEYYPTWGTQIIRLLMSSDGGRTWINLAGFGSSIYSSYNPKIVVDPQFYDTVYVVYETEISSTNYDIMGYAYNSTGSYFMYIDTDSNNDRYPCITCEFGFGTSNRIYVAYEELFTHDDRDMIVKHSTDKGSSWSTILELGAILDYNVYCDLSLAYTVDSNSYAHLYVAYVFGADYATGFSVGVYHSTNRGASWMHSWAISSSSNEKHYTSIAAGHLTGTAIVAWEMYYDATWLNDIQYAYSTDDGGSWTPSFLALSTNNERNVDISVDGQGEADWTIECPYFHVVYRVGNDVLYKRAAANRPQYWSAAEIVNSGGSASNSYRRPSVAGTIREDGSHHPSITWTEWTTPYAVYYTTRGGVVSLITNPVGLDILVGGVLYTAPTQFEWIAGMLVSFDAPLIQTGSTGVRYVWDYWIYGLSVRLSSSMTWACNPFSETIIANYETEYYLTVLTDHGIPSGEGWYTAGSIAYAGVDAYIVSGTPGQRFVFNNWTDDASGTSYSQSQAIIMDGPKTATATWTTQYQWTLEYVGDYVYQNSGWVDDGFYGHFVINTSPPGNSTTRFIFSHWSGDVSGTNMSQSSSILITSPVLAYAHWTTQYYIIVTTDHSTSPSTGWYNKSLTISVSVDDEYVSIDSGSRWRFDSWSGNATGSVYSASDSFLVDGSKTIYANWLTQYLLIIDSAYGSASGAGWYDSDKTAYAGLDADLVAGVAGERFIFRSWTDDGSGTDYTQSDAITMDGPKTATAVWDTEYYLTVTTDHGTPSGEGWYSSGSTANAVLDTDIVAGVTGERFVFQSWTADGSGTDYSQSDAITMDGPKTVSTTWQTHYHLTSTTNPSSLSPQPTTTPAGDWFNDGLIVILVAEAVTGYNFTHWLVDGVESEEGVSSIPLVMDEAHDAVAYYQETETTTTTTTGTTPPLDATMILVIIGAGGVGIVIVILLIVKKKKS